MAIQKPRTLPAFLGRQEGLKHIELQMKSLNLKEQTKLYILSLNQIDEGRGHIMAFPHSYHPLFTTIVPI